MMPVAVGKKRWLLLLVLFCFVVAVVDDVVLTISVVGGGVVVNVDGSDVVGGSLKFIFTCLRYRGFDFDTDGEAGFSSVSSAWIGIECSSEYFSKERHSTLQL